MVEVDDLADEVLIHVNFKNILEEDPEEVRKHVPAFLLNSLTAFLLLFNLLKLLYNCSLSADLHFLGNR